MVYYKEHKIGDVIANLRKKKDWTQNELAEKLKVSDKAISKWESNKGDPSIEFLPQLAELFGVTLDYLMTGKEVEEKSSRYNLLQTKDLDDKQSNITEEQIINCIHNGIVSIDELVALNDFDRYEKTLSEFPISIYQKGFDFIDKKDYKNLFKFLYDIGGFDSVIEDLKNKFVDKLQKDYEKCLSCLNFSNELNNKYLTIYIHNKQSSYYSYRKIDTSPTKENFNKAKNYLFLENVLDKDIRFIEKACKSATQHELDRALTQIQKNNFRGIDILLNYGARLYKIWTDDEGYRQEDVDEIGTEILKQKIKDVLGGNQ